MNELEFLAEREVDTERLGHALAAVLPLRTIVALSGTLGAGKTRLVQAVAEALGVPRTHVVSPTFTLRQEYRGDCVLHHVDLYRVADEDELWELGLDESCQSDCIMLIEWADRFAAELPAVRLEISIHVLEGDRRSFCIRSTSSAIDTIVEKLAERLDAASPGR
jgi:tRNA threonylcarbamoyladenosine biosynthesis protein TsaE